MTVCVWAVVVAVAGCRDAFGDQERRLGEPLGTFAVDAAQSVNSCGSGSLGSGEEWSFEVALSRSENEIYWDSGAETITGALQGDDSFYIETLVAVDMRDKESPAYLPPCTVNRVDVSSGALTEDKETGSVVGFEGTINYRFVPTQDSDCTDLTSGEGILFLTLPCDVEYDMRATLVEPPDPE